MDYKELIDERTLLNALERCAKSAMWKHSMQDALRNKLAIVHELHEQLERLDFSFPPHKEFDITERGKMRHIKAPGIKERVVQKALCENVLLPALSPSLIFDCPATLKGKGVSFARKRVIEHLLRFFRLFGRGGYVLQIDFKSYFSSINHKILFEKLRKKIRDEKILSLVESLIEHGGEGLGLGSEMSQILALFYTSEIDHFCKEVLRLKFYARYMDDIYAIHTSRFYLEECLEKIRTLSKIDGIELNKKKTKIVPLESGFSFLKVRYRISKSGRIIRIPDKSTFRREKRRIRKMSKLVREGVLDANDVLNAYKSWRKPLAKFDCHKRLLKCDEFLRQFPILF